jgi:hypothetical protein
MRNILTCGVAKEPRDMSSEEFAQRVSELNDYLSSVLWKPETSKEIAIVIYFDVPNT